MIFGSRRGWNSNPVGVLGAAASAAEAEREGKGFDREQGMALWGCWKQGHRRHANYHIKRDSRFYHRSIIINLKHVRGHEKIQTKVTALSCHKGKKQTTHHQPGKLPLKVVIKE